MINSLSDNKILVSPELKAFGNDNPIFARNIVGKGGNAGYLHFFLFPQCFLKASFPGSLKVFIVRYRVNPFPLSDTF